MAQPSPIEAIASELRPKVESEAHIVDLGATIASVIDSADPDVLTRLVASLRQGSGAKDIRQYLQHQISRYPDYYGYTAKQMELGFGYTPMDAFFELETQLGTLSVIILNMIAGDIERKLQKANG